MIMPEFKPFKSFKKFKPSSGFLTRSPKRLQLVWNDWNV